GTPLVVGAVSLEHGA
ncbi:hypothetical protein HaLaN_14100, partial [Haematococcus lacustris]